MEDLAIIDRFTETFSRYIDSGFGLVSGDVMFLTSVLVALDITLAGLFWALNGEDNVPAQLIKKDSMSASLRCCSTTSRACRRWCSSRLRGLV